MILKLSIKEFEELKRIDILGRGIFIDVEIDESMRKYFIENMENNYKSFKDMIPIPNLKRNALYKKLKEVN